MISIKSYKYLLSKLIVSTFRPFTPLFTRRMSSFDENDSQHEYERRFQELDPKQFEILAENENQLNEIELILSKYEYLKYSSGEVPSTLTINHMKELLALKKHNKRHEYLKYLFIKERKVFLSKQKKENNKRLKEIELKSKWNEMNANRTGLFDKDLNIVYGLWHNALFMRLCKQNISRYSNHRLRNASLFGQNIVFDLSNSDQLSSKTCQAIASEICKSYYLNRRYFKEPFNLNFCNLDYNSIIWRIISQRLEFVNRPDFFVNCTQNSYLDLFKDKSKLVYISSKAKKLLNFDPNRVYILGYQERNQTESVVEVMARKEKIEFQRLPIDQYVLWNSGSKDLRFYQILQILNDMKDGFEWSEAIVRNIQQKNFKTPEQLAEEESLRTKKMAKKFNLKF